MAIVIVGGGISGLATAFALCKQGFTNITLIAEEFGSSSPEPRITSDIAGAVWVPYHAGDTPHEKIKKWAYETFLHLFALIKAGHHWVKVVGGTKVDNEPIEVEDWALDVFGFHEMAKPIKVGDLDFAYGYEFDTIVVTPTMYLAWLRDTVLSCGVRIIQRRVGSLAELTGYDVVINCAGLQSTALVPDDSLMPARGVLLHVELDGPPVSRYYYHVSPLIYIIPRPQTNYVLFGGTVEEGNADPVADPALCDRLLKGCMAILGRPVSDARVVRTVVGFRPLRTKGVRLCVDRTLLPYTPVIHNVGHGGSGYTLHWGCAQEVCALVREVLTGVSAAPTSKL